MIWRKITLYTNDYAAQPTAAYPSIKAYRKTFEQYDRAKPSKTIIHHEGTYINRNIHIILFCS